MKKVLGLDLGTNSIGWALVEIDHEKRLVKIIGLGSRILSMDAGEIKNFESGTKIKSTAAQKTTDKTARKLNERFLLRRDRLHCVLNLLQTLPKHYTVAIDFETEKGYRSGKFKKGLEEKLAYIKDLDGKSRFLFTDAYKEMEAEFKIFSPHLFYKKKNGKETKIPYDWTQYYLRKKALTKEITKEELAWIVLSFNQKRGYTKTIGQDEKKQKEGELSEVFIGKVKAVNKIESTNQLKLYEIILADDIGNEIYRYKEDSLFQITNVDDLKEIEIISKYDEEGAINETVYIIKEIRNLKVTNVKYTDKKNKENIVFEVFLETGWLTTELSRRFPKWIDTQRDFIIKTNYDKDGNKILKGKDHGRNIKSPEEDDWTLMKLKTETTLYSFNTKNKTCGIASYVYDTLLKKPNQKIKGNLITVIEREFYREELQKIFECQKQFHPELENPELYQKAIHILYPHNENHRNTIQNFDFAKLITDDVILYQRDLKSKKSLIANCVYEKENFTKRNTKTGKEYQEPLKGIHKANPLYQEFRLWQFIKRLKIIQLETKINDEVLVNQDVSKSFLTNEVKEKLFEYLNDREFITQSVLLKHLGLSEKQYKWNYDEEHKEPCNETRHNFILRLKRLKGFDWKSFLTLKNEKRIWHFFYSVKKQEEFKKGIYSLFEKLLNESNEELPDEHKFDLNHKDDLVKNFIGFEGYKNDYGSYSEKALNKLLPFLRIGKHWEATKNIAENILKTVEHTIKEKVLVKEDINGEVKDFQGLWISSACYIVYNRYAEVGDLQYWNTPNDIDYFIRNDFKQHSLNNPVVEKVLIETLQLVKDVWKYYGVQNPDGSYQKLYDEIHIELGREMKKNEKERKREFVKGNENKKANERIIELLKELQKENRDINIKSPFQQEKLRILEEGLLSSIEFDKDVKTYPFNTSGSITKKEIKEITSKEISKISKSDFERYRLWMDQRYQSPYTGEVIKLSDLFNRAKYEVDHIFPQERITLNAQYNKVICETEVNKAKKANTGYQFILNSNGNRTIKCAAHNSREVKILNKVAYEQLVKSNFTDKKQEILLSKDIPEDFTNSQLNNARYISKMAMKFLSNLVREEGEDSFRSKNVLPVTGLITTKLKQDWRLNDAWNELVQPRFKRLNELTKSNLFGRKEKIDGHEVFINYVPEELNSDFDKKRIDHRHHALDALVIALTTENHVNYLNNISSQDGKEDKLEHRIRIKNRITDTKRNEDGDKSRFFLPPAQYKQGNEVIPYSYQYEDCNTEVFKDVALEALQNTVVSFKQKNKVIKQRTNKYKKWDEEAGKIKMTLQEKLNSKEHYNVRQSLHLATFYGKVKLQKHIKQLPFTEAILQTDNLVNTKLKMLIIDLKNNQKLSDEQITAELKSKYPKIQVYENYVATRFNNDLESFAVVESDKIIQTINSITDTGIQKILLKHLERYNSVTKSIKEAIDYVSIIVNEEHQKVIKDLLNDNATFEEIAIDNMPIKETEIFIRTLNISNNESKIILNPQLAFSFQGIKELNENIVELNGGKNHKPIYKVRMKDALGTKFSVSEEGEKSTKYVVTAPGSNAYCGVYEKEKGERKFVVPTLRETIENLKQGNPACMEQIFDEKTLEKFNLKFILLPSDLVFVPNNSEIKNPSLVNFKKLTKEQINRVYKFTDGSGTTLNFVPYSIASLLYNIPKKEAKKLKEKYNLNYDGELQNELGLGSPQSKNQNSIDGIQIKSVCIKLNVDRLGNIKPAP